VFTSVHCSDNNVTFSFSHGHHKVSAFKNSIYILKNLHIFTVSHTLDPMSRVLLVKITGSQPEMKLSTFHGTERFIIMLKTAYSLSVF
jgi:hypothetical protein